MRVKESKTGEKIIGVNAKPGQALDLCAPLLLWKQRCEASDSDYIFRGLNKNREMTGKPISAKLMTQYVKTGCQRIGYNDVSEFSPHSLRSGRITSSARDGATASQLMGLSKHKSLSSLQKYIKMGDFEHGL